MNSGITIASVEVDHKTRVHKKMCEDKPYHELLEHASEVINLFIKKLLPIQVNNYFYRTWTKFNRRRS